MLLTNFLTMHSNIFIHFSKVVDFLQPDELAEKFDFEIGNKGEDNDTLLKHCEDTIKYSVKTGISPTYLLRI